MTNTRETPLRWCLVHRTKVIAISYILFYAALRSGNRTSVSKE